VTLVASGFVRLADKVDFGQFGLGRAVLESGAYLLGSRWKVSDVCAKTFALAFYDVLFKGLSMGEAVTKARQVCKHTHPNDLAWASYAYYGDPRVCFRGDVPALLGKTSEEAQLKGRIESPNEGEILPPGYCEVRGRVLNYSGQPLYVMTGRDDTYWPGGRIAPQADMTWSSSVNLGSRIDTHTIFLATVDENTATLIDLYRRNAAAEKKWTGVPIRPLQVVLDQIAVRTDLSQ
jgi:hypothetical protein